jgi:dTDP-4-amino-4,6-dideoxygalactose transaminase
MTEAPIPFGRPYLTEEDRAAVMDVLRGDMLAHGPQGKAFEEAFREFIGGGHCLSVSSGMAALHLAYLQMGIGPGDEVVVTALTHTATAHAVEMVGATPVFADVRPETGNIDPAEVEKLITPKTRAIALVHFMGIPCDMDALSALAARHRLAVVEDCAIALGARHRGVHVGLIGDAGAFSFYPVKHITTGEGGMFVTRHAEVAKKVHAWRAFGVDRSFAERTVPGLYDVTTLGLNYRMSDINAALGRTQMRHLPEILRRREENFQRLRRALDGAPGMRVLAGAGDVAAMSPYGLSLVIENISVEKRNEALLRLKERGIGTSVYYPQPLPRMTYYRNKYPDRPTAHPRATEISDQSIALPVGPHLTESDIDRIARETRRAVQEVRP